MPRRRTAVLVSGRGSNLQALIEAAAAPDYPATIALVISNRPGAAALERAAAAGIPTRVIDHRAYPGGAAFEAALDRALRAEDIELVCLAGFMRVLGPDFVDAWRDRLLNIHPSLLPAFPGLNTHARTLAAGVRIAGCTVHFVRAAVDQGPIIVQAAVPVQTDDDEASLAARILAAEHQCYPLALRLVASGAATIVDERVVLAGARPAVGRLISPEG